MDIVARLRWSKTAAAVAAALAGAEAVGAVLVLGAPGLARVLARRGVAALAVRARPDALPVATGALGALVAVGGADAADEWHRALRPGGAVANLEFAVPANPAWRLSWHGYTRLVLPTAGFLTGGPEWAAVGRFLGPSISEHYRRYPLDWTVDAWRAAGIEDVQVRRMSLGGGLVMWGRKADG